MARLSAEAVFDGLKAAASIREGCLPTQADLDAAPVMTLWTLEPVGGGLARLAGLVVGHPQSRDGPCFTSAVLAIDPEMRWARTVSRLYVLGPSILDELAEQPPFD